MAKFNKDKSTLVAEKCQTEISEEEIAIGKKDNVRKGRDLEDLNLSKFATLHGGDKPLKPVNMYCVKDFPYLTINFDGVIEENGFLIPVEAKFVSSYGDKYYNRKVALQREFGEVEASPLPRPYIANDIVDMCEAYAAKCGVPAYYYAQVQQQMLGLEAPYGYLSALHDKGWELVIYRIPRNDEVISKIKVEGFKVWNKIEKRRAAD